MQTKPERSRDKKVKATLSFRYRRPRSEAGCDHRRCSVTMVFTELGCHARCLACGALGPGCSDSNAARQSLQVPNSREYNIGKASRTIREQQPGKGGSVPYAARG